MSTSSVRLPSSPFPLLPLRNGVLFPGTIITLPVGRERSVALVQQLSKGDLLGVATQKDPAVDDPATADLHPIGTIARVADLAPAAERRLPHRARGARPRSRSGAWCDRTCSGSPRASARFEIRRRHQRRAALCGGARRARPRAGQGAAARSRRWATPRRRRACSPTAWRPRWACPPTRRSPCSRARRRGAAAPGRGARGRGAGDGRGEAQDRSGRPARAGQGPARGHPSRAAQGHQEGAGRGQAPSDDLAALRERLDKAGLRRGARRRRPRAQAPRTHLAPAGRARRGAHLPGADRRSALERARRDKDDIDAVPPSSTPTTSASTT